MMLLVILTAVGCGAPGAVSTSERAGVEEAAEVAESALPVDLTHETVQTLQVEEEIVVVDVRQPEEYAAGHIPGAELIPLNELPDRLDEIPQDERVVLVCRSGNRSNQAQRLLNDAGFDNVHNMLGGMNAWQQAGYEVRR
jgi:rhodanese-related sulfurtransferase